MVETKIYCDLCKRQVENYTDLEFINLDTKSGLRLRYEVCTECRRKIIRYIDSLKDGE